MQLIKKEMINRGWVNRNGRLINKKLADASGVNAGTVSRFLNDKSINMKLDNLYQLLMALDLIKDVNDGLPPVERETRNKDDQAMPVEYQSLDKEARELIEDLMQIVHHGNTDMKNAVRMGIKGVLANINKEEAANEQEMLIKKLQENYQAIIKRLDMLAGPAGSKGVPPPDR